MIFGRFLPYIYIFEGFASYELFKRFLTYELFEGLPYMNYWEVFVV